MSRLSIEVVSDLVCPWCFIGSRRLEEALSRVPQLEVDVEYLPFLLDPTLPPEGADLRERLAKRFGAEPSTMFTRVEEAARSSGIPLDFQVVRRFSNTLGAHTLIAAARERGTQRALVNALFAAYFLEGVDLSDEHALTRIATAHGFGEEEALERLRDESARGAARALAADLASQGIGGVPFFIFGERLAVSGAQPVEVLIEAITRASS
jgi:predicted DsbA family dithiol-disulfide isomerase